MVLTEQQKNQEDFRAIFEAAPVGMCVIDAERNWLIVNPKFCDITGYSPEELTHKTFLDITHPDDLEISDNLFWKAIHGELLGYAMEKRYIRKDGQSIWVKATRSVSRSPDGAIRVIAIVEDISKEKTASCSLQKANVQLEELVAARTAELNKAHESLKELTAHIQRLRERERKRFAHEIHDEIAGSLAALKFDISMRKLQIAAGQTVSLEDFDYSIALVDGAIESLRRIITDLRPSLLDTLGLWAALDWLTQQFEAQTGACASFKVNRPDFEVEEELATGIFRIVQEALANIRKHAGASLVEIRVHVSDKAIQLTIRDNGVGIAPEELAQKPCFGIRIMKQRARIFRGKVRILRQAGGGTTVVTRFPLARDESPGGTD